MTTNRRDPRNAAELCGALLLATVTVALAGYSEELCQLDLQPLALLCGAIMGLVLAYVVLVSRGYTWTVYNVYICIFCLFHFGLIVIQALDLDTSLAYKAYIRRWFFSYYGNYAVVLVTIGLTALVAGVVLLRGCGVGRKASAGRPLPDRQQDRVLGVAGLVLVALSVLGWFAVVVSHGGVALLTGSYQAFLKATAGYLPGWLFYFPLGWGLIVLTVASPSPLRRAGFLLFALFAVVALPLGLRGEVLFPAFSALAVAGMQGLRLNLKKTVVIGVVLLCAISVLRQVRHVGIEETRLDTVAVAPIDALAELGSSIRPVVEVVSWSDSGEEYIYGQSYWAPVDRMLVYLLPGWTRPPLRDDDRLLNVLVQERVGPIGFSPVAEAYRNFGKYGVAGVMLLTGMLLAWLDSWPPTQTNRLVAGFVFFPLLVQVRNAFVFVPANIVVGFLILLVLSQFYKAQKPAAEPGLYAIEEGRGR